MAQLPNETRQDYALRLVTMRQPFSPADFSLFDELEELRIIGLVLRVSDVNTDSRLMNPSYTYVTNDELGKKRATEADC